MPSTITASVETMELKVIKTYDEYKNVLHKAEELVARDPGAGSEDAGQLELLTVLVEDFERRHFSMPTPDPVDAIEFRMNEQGLRQRDLVPLLGSRSRVSEVLSRKRPLTVQMIRALTTGLGIPADALLGSADLGPSRKIQHGELDLTKFPVREMEKRGWFKLLKIKPQNSPVEAVKAFLAQISAGTAAQALYRRTFRGEQVDNKSYYSVLAWTARALVRAKDLERGVAKYDSSRITPSVFRELAQLSWFDRGPALVPEFLSKYGIVLIVEPRLPNTLIDGAALLTERGTPVIGLTLRYDRLDYFWYTVLHELAHVSKHLNTVEEAFIDRVENVESTNTIEKQANRIARDALIPRVVWKRSQAFLAPTRESIQELADSLHIHPALIAGRLQHETGRYDSFREFLGQGSVRRFFPDLTF